MSARLAALVYRRNAGVVTSWIPDLVVGIDLGAIGTAVAFSCGPEWPEPRFISSWPGPNGHVFGTKVPSRVSYSANDPKKLKQWGFGCDFDNSDEIVETRFRVSLDPEYYSVDDGIIDIESATTCMTDFLGCLFGYICSYLEYESINITGKRVEFQFSVPPWKETAVKGRLLQAIARAGFNRHPHYQVKVDFSGAEATAFSAVPSSIVPGTAVVLCHTGGFFTEICVLEACLAVSNKLTKMINFETKMWTSPEPIGSALIDYAVHDRIKESLRVMGTGSKEVPDAVPRLMMGGQYRIYKLVFGSDSGQFPDLDMPYPPSYVQIIQHRPGALLATEGSVFTLLEDEMRSLFDMQINRLFTVIERSIATAQKIFPARDILLVMSGGFSDSPYLRKRFQEWEGAMKRSRKRGVITSIFTSDGKLQVAHGLVSGRISALKSRAKPNDISTPDTPDWQIILGRLLDKTAPVSQRVEQLSKFSSLAFEIIQRARLLQRQIHPVLSLTESVYVENALSGTEDDVRNVISDDVGGSAKFSQDNEAFTFRLVKAYYSLQHLVVVTAYLNNSYGQDNPMSQISNSINVTAGESSHELSRASSIVTTRTKFSTTTTVQGQDQDPDRDGDGRASIELNIGNVIFRIARDGSMITTGPAAISPPSISSDPLPNPAEPTDAPPPYTPNPPNHDHDYVEAVAPKVT